MQKVLKEEKLVIQVTGIFCDICTKDCNTSKNEARMEEYALLSYQWGCGSKKDGEKGYLHICEECYDMIDKFIQEKKPKDLEKGLATQERKHDGSEGN